MEEINLEINNYDNIIDNIWTKCEEKIDAHFNKKYNQFDKETLDKRALSVPINTIITLVVRVIDPNLESIYFNIWADNEKKKRIAHISIGLQENCIILNHKTKKKEWAKSEKINLEYDKEDEIIKIDLELDVLCTDLHIDNSVATHIRMSSSIIKEPYIYPLYHTQADRIENISSNIPFRVIIP